MTPSAASDAWPFLCGIGFTGFAGACLLLFISIRMWREEQDRRKGIVNREKPPSNPDEPSSLQKAAHWLMGAAKVAAETTAKAATTAANSAASAATNAVTRNNPPDAHEVLRVLRDNLTGRIVIEIAGKRYAKIGGIQDPNIGHAFLTTMRDLNRFASGQAPLQSAPAGTPAPQPPAPPPEAAPRAVPTPPPPQAAPAHGSGFASPPEQPPLRVPSMNPFKQRQILREMEKNTPPPPKSITEQIDEVLQEKVVGTPLAGRGVHVRSSPDGSAAFDLDGKSYSAVDDVPDAEVRETIRLAIKEWEKRQ